MSRSSIIGDGIRITVLSVRGDCVRLGVSAPPEVRVDRQEVHRRRQENEAAPDHPAG